MDVDLWFRLARTGHVALLPGEALARFRLHPAAKSVADLTGAIREDLWILPSLRRLKRSVLGKRVSGLSAAGDSVTRGAPRTGGRLP